MPNLLAHRLLIELSTADLEIDEHAKSVLLIATQGPDPLFYYGLMPWRSMHLLAAKKKYGSKIHHTNGEKYFTALFNSYDKIDDQEQKEIFLAFIVGQYLHKVLDKYAHPYVYYQSGFNDVGRLKGVYHYEHANFESEIDSCLAKKYEIINFVGHTQDALKLDKKLINAINRPLKNAIKEMFNARVSKRYFSNSLKNMISMQKLANKKIIRKLTGKKSMFNALYTPTNCNGDPLNLEKNDWYHPVTKEKHNESFIELLEQAKAEAEVVLNDYKKGLINKEYILSRLGDLNYNGLKVGEKLTYWKRKGE